MGCMQILIKLFNSLRQNEPNILLFDLQRFAGEKTEEPTAKRKSETRQKGQVAKSVDLSSSVIILAAFFSSLRGRWATFWLGWCRISFRLPSS